jgi:threonine dehydratase
MSSLPKLSDIEAARARIAPYLPVTPATQALSLSDEFKRTIYLKWDNKLRTGSFKERGALNFLLSLDAPTLARGVCTASAGNHALGLSFHAQRLSTPCHIVMPASAPLVKIQSCRAFGAEVTFKPTFAEALEYAQVLASERGLTYVPPFDHEWIVHGQGVAGLEALEQIPDFDSVIIPVGGGGYASGVATAIKAKRPDVFILGVCSEWAAEFRRNPASHQGPVVPMTIADGIAVKTIGKVTAPILDKRVDQIVPVSEWAIARAIILLLEHEHVVVEGAGAAGLAGLISGHLPEQCKKPLIFICGSNIDTNLLSRLIEHDMAEKGRLLRATITLPDRPGMLHTITGIIAGEGANILQVTHDRSYAKIPGYVEITVLMEVRDRDHADSVISSLTRAGLPTVEV